MSAKGTKFVAAHVPDDLFRKVSVMCAERGISKRQLVLNLLEQEVTNHESRAKGGKNNGEGLD